MHAHVQRQLSSSEGERLNRDRERERSDFGSRASALMYMFMAGNLAVYIYSGSYIVYDKI